MASLRYPKWEEFQDEKVTEILHQGGKILDIGGGLRIAKGKGNRFDEARYRKFSTLLERPNVEFYVSDYTDKYAPDLVEDIHALSFENESLDGVFCLAVMEHIEFPHRAAAEILRVLKKGGRAYIYVPFLYRYHAHDADYHDYFRYSVDAIRALFKDASDLQIQPVRGFLETLTKFTPLQRYSILNYAARFADTYCPPFRKRSFSQASGYNFFVVK